MFYQKDMLGVLFGADVPTQTVSKLSKAQEASKSLLLDAYRQVPENLGWRAKFFSGEQAVRQVTIADGSPLLYWDGIYIGKKQQALVINQMFKAPESLQERDFQYISPLSLFAFMNKNDVQRLFMPKGFMSGGGMPTERFNHFFDIKGDARALKDTGEYCILQVPESLRKAVKQNCQQAYITRLQGLTSIS